MTILLRLGRAVDGRPERWRRRLVRRFIGIETAPAAVGREPVAAPAIAATESHEHLSHVVVQVRHRINSALPPLLYELSHGLG